MVETILYYMFIASIAAVFARKILNLSKAVCVSWFFIMWIIDSIYEIHGAFFLIEYPMFERISITVALLIISELLLTNRKAE